MNDSSISIILVFSVYKDMGVAKYIMLTVVFTTYLATVMANATMILFIFLDSSLHKPMYMFLLGLILNGLMGSTAIWPKVMTILLTDDNTISHAGCILQISLMRLYGGCSYTILAVMAYDRFVAIFNPLNYQTIMRPQSVGLLVFAACFIPFSLVLCEACLLSRMRLCSYTLQRIYCNLDISNLSCDAKDSYVARSFSTVGNVIILLSVVVIILSYLKILLLVRKFPADTRKKSLATCAPHLVMFSTFAFVSVFPAIFKRLHPVVSTQTQVIRPFILATNYILLPPLLHPVVYGFNNKDIKTATNRIWLLTGCRIVPKLKVSSTINVKAFGNHKGSR